MPAFGSKHDCRIYMLFLRQLCFRLFHNLTADFLPQRIFTIKLGGNLLCLNTVVGYQKLHRQLRMLQPAHSVQARCQTKADVIGSNARFRTAAGLNQSTQSHKLRCFHSLQSTAHQLAVFADQRHNIRHRSKRRQLCKFLPLRQPARLALLQRLTQLEGNAYTAQILKRIAAVTLLGVDNCVGRRQNLRHRMVVRNNNIKRFRRIGYLAQTANAAVHGNNQCRTLLRNIFQCFVIKAVALAFTLRNIGGNLTAALLQIKIQQGGGTDSVHIIVAVNRNLLSHRQGPLYTLNRTLHILQQKRVMKGSSAAVEKITHRSCILQTALQQNTCDHRRNIQLLRQIVCHLTIIFFYIPNSFLVHHWRLPLSAAVLSSAAGSAFFAASACAASLCNSWVCCSMATRSCRRLFSACSCCISSRIFLSFR